MKKRLSSLYPLLLLFLLIGPLLCTHLIVHIDLPEKGQVALFYGNQNRDDLRLTFVKAIQEAQSSILLMIYTLTDKSIIEALKEKAQQGVKVEILIDEKQARKVKKKDRAFFNFNKQHSKGLMHHKILVIDQTRIYLGSANMTSDSLLWQANLVAGIYSKEMATKIREKADQLLAQTRNTLSPTTYQISDQEVELWFLPDPKAAKERLIKLLTSAEKTIKVAMFTFTEPEITQTLIEAKKRGVNVEVIVDHYSGKGASAKVVQILKEAQIPIALSQGRSLMHHKFAYIDQKKLIQGSANWTKAAFQRNDDNFTIFHNLTKKQRKKIEAIWTVQRFESQAA